MTHRHATRVATALLAAALLTGCSAHRATPPTAGAPATPTLSAPAMDDDAAGTPPPTTVPAADAVRVATGALAAFARPALPYDTWWAGVAPYLSAGAQSIYAYTDPANIPVRSVTTPGQRMAGGTTYLSEVSFDTNVGRVVVLLSRREDTGAWQVERFALPSGVK